VVIALLARHSVAWPLALSGFPPVLFAVTGSDPLPNGGVVILLAGWIALSITIAVALGRELPPLAVFLSIPVLSTAALAAWMLVRLGASPAPGYGQQKVQLFLAGNVMFMLGGVIAGWRPKQLRLLLKLVFLVSFAGAAVLGYQFLTGGAKATLPDRFTLSASDDPIALGRDSAGGLLIGIYLLLTVRSSTTRLLLALSVPVLAIALVAAGSRGPVVGVMAGLVVFAALTVSSRGARRRLLSLAGAVLGSVIVVPIVVPQAAVSRSLEIFAVSGGGLSSNGRTGLWGDAVSTFASHTFMGIGTGGFSAVQVAEAYPHSLLLEVASELGVVGLALVTAMVVGIVVRLITSWRQAAADEQRLDTALILALFSTGFVNALFSGALPDNRVVWLWAGVGVGLSGARMAARSHARRRPPTGAALAPHPS
jgi:O-antigen ligase